MNTLSEAGDEGWRHRVAHVNGVRLHFVEHGSGPLVLLLHGYPECWLTWCNQIGPLAAAGYRVVAPDMRGYGRSSRPERIDAYRISELVTDAAELVAALGESEAIVVGHDWGAGVAWSAAWTRPDVFRAVAGLSIPFGGRAIIPLPTAPLGEKRPSEMHRIVAGDPGVQFYRDYWMSDAFVEEVEADVGDYIRRVIFGFSADGIPADAVPDFRTTSPQQILEFTRLTGACIPRGGRSLDNLPPAPEQPPAWMADIEDLVAAAEYTGLTGAVNYYGALDVSWESLAPFEGRPVAVPALYVGADRDVATLWGAESIGLFDETVPELTEPPVILTDCGHWMPRERAEETNAALLRFLAAVG